MSLGATVSRPDAAQDATAELEQVDFLDFSEADPLVKAAQAQKAAGRRSQTGGMSIVIAKQVTPPESAPKNFFRKPANSGVYRS